MLFGQIWAVHDVRRGAAWLPWREEPAAVQLYGAEVRSHGGETRNKTKQKKKAAQA